MKRKLNYQADARRIVEGEVPQETEVYAAGLVTAGRNLAPFWLPINPQAIGITSTHVVMVPTAIVRPTRRRAGSSVALYSLDELTLVRHRSNFAYSQLKFHTVGGRLYFPRPGNRSSRPRPVS